MPSLDCCCHTLLTDTSCVKMPVKHVCVEARRSSEWFSVFSFCCCFFPADTALTKNNEI